MKSLVALVVLVAVAAPAVSGACLNDVESRKWQLQPRAPERIIAGDFVREPKEYYQFRIDRLELKQKREGLALHEFDDLAVAYDRAGDPLKAIAVMKQRELQAQRPLTERDIDIPHFDVEKGLSAEDYLRYSALANHGTFEIHVWTGAGRPDGLSRVERGLRMLEEAVRINPDAHSGREWVQIEITKWMMRLKTNPAEPYPAFNRSKAEVISGLVGLIELGTAWQNLDVYRMIVTAAKDVQPTVAIFAAQRVEELESVGTKPKTSAPWTAPKFPRASSHYEGMTFDQFRRWSDQTLEERTDYVKAKLAVAKTEEDLVRGFKPTPSPEAKRTVAKPWHRRPDYLIMVNGGIAVLVVIGVFVVLKVVRSRVRR